MDRVAIPSLELDLTMGWAEGVGYVNWGSITESDGLAGAREALMI